MSAERPTGTLKSKDNPPKKAAPTEVPPKDLDTSAARARANDTFDSMRADVFAAGVKTQQISRVWSRAERVHKDILATIEKYENATDPEARERYKDEIQTHTAMLAGDIEEDVRRAYQSLAIRQPKENDPTYRPEGKKPILPPEFNEVLERTMSEESKHFEENALKEKLAEARAQLAALDELAVGKGLSSNSEGRYLKLEEEVRTLEHALGREEPIDEIRHLTLVEQKKRLRDLVESLSYDGEAHHPTPAIREKAPPPTSYEGEPNYPVPAISVTQLNEKHADGMDEPLRSLIRETRGEAALSALEKLGGSDEKGRERRDACVPFATEMYQKEKAYLEALRAHQKSRGFGSIALEQVKEHTLPKDVKKLRDQWVESRAKYAGFLKEGLRERYMQKHGKDFGYDSKREKEVLKRYERMVVGREVVFGAEEAEQRARMEGLSLRHKQGIDKAFDRYKKLPPALRIIGTSALLMGGMALITGGGALAAIPLITGGAGAVLRVIGEKKNIKLLKGMGLSLGALAGALGEYGVRGFHAVTGTRAKAKETLSSGAGNLSDAQSLDRISKNRKKAITVDERISRQGRIGRFFAALTGGALAGGVHTLENRIHEGMEDTNNKIMHTFAGTSSDTGHPIPYHAPIPHETHPAGSTAPVTHESAATGMTHETSHAAHNHMTHAPPAHHEQPASTAAPASSEARPAQDESQAHEADAELIMKWEGDHKMWAEHPTEAGLPQHADEHILDPGTGVVDKLHANYGHDAFKGVTYGPEHPDTSVSAEPHHDQTPAEVAPLQTPAAPVETHTDATAEDHTAAPTETHAPTPEAPAYTNAPQSHDVSGSTPEHPATNAVPSSSAELAPFTNAHGVTVDLHAPQQYAWNPPHTKDVFPIALGGDDASRAAWADAKLQQDHSIPYILVPVTNPETQGVMMQLHQLDVSGRPVQPIGAVLDPRTGMSLPPPDTKDLVPLPKIK